MKNMGIDHGGHHVAVRQQLLGRADIIRELQQVNGERLPSPGRSLLWVKTRIMWRRLRCMALLAISELRMTIKSERKWNELIN